MYITWLHIFIDISITKDKNGRKGKKKRDNLYFSSKASRMRSPCTNVEIIDRDTTYIFYSSRSLCRLTKNLRVEGVFRLLNLSGNVHFLREEVDRRRRERGAIERECAEMSVCREGRGKSKKKKYEEAWKRGGKKRGKKKRGASRVSCHQRLACLLRDRVAPSLSLYFFSLLASPHFRATAKVLSLMRTVRAELIRLVNFRRLASAAEKVQRRCGKWTKAG